MKMKKNKEFRCALQPFKVSEEPRARAQSDRGWAVLDTPV